MAKWSRSLTDYEFTESYWRMRWGYIALWNDFWLEFDSPPFTARTFPG